MWLEVFLLPTDTLAAVMKVRNRMNVLFTNQIYAHLPNVKLLLDSLKVVE